MNAEDCYRYGDDGEILLSCEDSDEGPCDSPDACCSECHGRWVDEEVRKWGVPRFAPVTMTASELILEDWRIG